MPCWSIAYLGVYVALAIGGVWIDYCDHHKPWYIAVAIISNLVVIVLFIAFWYPAFNAFSNWAARAVFLLSMCWELFQMIEEVREARADPELTTSHARMTATALALVALPICMPAYVIAGMAAFRV